MNVFRENSSPPWQKVGAPVLSLLPVLVLAVVVLLSGSTFCKSKDLTDSLEYVGDPYRKRYPRPDQLYAKNIWDMIVFHRKLYMGAGNSSNLGPATGAGPVPIICYDPLIDAFETSYTVNDEQVDSFYIFKDTLYVPGHDPKESWALGNLYSYGQYGVWQKQRTIPNGIHTYALAYHRGKLFAALGAPKKRSLAGSDSLGQSWKTYLSGADRTYAFLLVEGRLFATSQFFSQEILKHIEHLGNFVNAPVYQYKQTYESFENRDDLIRAELFFPDTDIAKIHVSKIVRPQQFGDKAVYIGAQKHNDHQAMPFGAYVVSSLEKWNIKTERVPLPENTVPWDILCRNGSVYLLTAAPYGSLTKNSVWQSTNAKDWLEIFSFTTETFARSFELLNGYFYFSLGDEVPLTTGNKEAPGMKESALSAETGKLFRIKVE